MKIILDWRTNSFNVLLLEKYYGNVAHYELKIIYLSESRIFDENLIFYINIKIKLINK